MAGRLRRARQVSVPASAATRRVRSLSPSAAYILGMTNTSDLSINSAYDASGPGRGGDNRAPGPTERGRRLFVAAAYIDDMTFNSNGHRRHSAPSIRPITTTTTSPVQVRQYRPVRELYRPRSFPTSRPGPLRCPAATVRTACSSSRTPRPAPKGSSDGKRVVRPVSSRLAELLAARPSVDATFDSSAAIRPSVAIPAAGLSLATPRAPQPVAVLRCPASHNTR